MCFFSWCVLLQNHRDSVRQGWTEGQLFADWGWLPSAGVLWPMWSRHFCGTWLLRMWPGWGALKRLCPRQVEPVDRDWVLLQWWLQAGGRTQSVLWPQNRPVVKQWAVLWANHLLCSHCHQQWLLPSLRRPPGSSSGGHSNCLRVCAWIPVSWRQRHQAVRRYRGMVRSETILRRYALLNYEVQLSVC